MQRYMIGDFIREMRMEMGYSQEELCDGICSPGNLSKIENNTRRPELNKLEALLQRLGCKECFTVFADKKGFWDCDLEGFVMLGKKCVDMFMK